MNNSCLGWGAASPRARLAGGFAPAAAAGLCLVALAAGCARPLPDSTVKPASPARTLAPPGPPRPARDWVRISADSRGCVAGRAEKPFVPWGFNYDRDYQMRLLEDYWEAEWDTVTQDFREMKALGANVVRLHLQFAKFMLGPDQPNPRALRQLARLLALAEDTGLYLDLTGLACYRKAEVPAWYDRLEEADRWRAQARFWEAIARTCRRSPAVFCYNLMNEPVVPGSPRKPGDWLLGELAGFHYVQAITLRPGDRARPEIARAWVEQLTAAIRQHDRRHLITLGFLPNSLETPVSGSGFPPAKVAGSLDFVCVHLYPGRGRLEADLETLRGFDVGKPVVIEEIFPLSCSPGELREFIEKSRPHAAGWIGFYWGQTPEELAREKTVAAALTGQCLELFQALAPGAR